MIASPTEQCGVEAVGPVLTITLRRPDKLNAITPDMRAAIAEAIEAFITADDLRVLVVRAEGRYFSAGMDIGGMSQQPDSGIALRRDYRRLHDMFDLLERVEKPVVFAIQGPCLGGALEMALSADFRLASSAATFGLPEIRIGVIPGSGGTSRLTRLVGPGWARWLAMAAQTVDARQAREMGLVQAVYDAAEFDAAVDRFVEGLVALPREVLGLSKLAIDLSATLDRQSARDVERIANTMLMKGEEHREAIARFRDRAKKKQ